MNKVRFNPVLFKMIRERAQIMLYRKQLICETVCKSLRITQDDNYFVYSFPNMFKALDRSYGTYCNGQYFSYFGQDWEMNQLRRCFLRFLINYFKDGQQDYVIKFLEWYNMVELVINPSVVYQFEHNYRDVK